MLDQILERTRARTRWWLVALGVTASWAGLVHLIGWNSIAGDWFVTAMRACSGGAMGWFVSRYVIGLDISAIPENDRSNAAFAQAIIVAGFAVAVA